MLAVSCENASQDPQAWYRFLGNNFDYQNLLGVLIYSEPVVNAFAYQPDNVFTAA